MATLTALKTRLITETNRDDMGSGGELETTLTLVITQAIEFWSDTQFWFNRASGSGNTTANVATIAMPSGIRTPEVAAYNGTELRKVPLSEFQFRTETGSPSAWNEDEGAIHLWPIPDAVYAISVYGTASTGIPASGGDSNIWTTEAYDLIAATARKMLYRDYLRDVEGATLAQAAEGEALARLERETRRRGSALLATDVPLSRGGFDITRG